MSNVSAASRPTSTHTIDLTDQRWEGVLCRELHPAKGDFIEVRVAGIPSSGCPWVLARLGEGCVLHDYDVSVQGEGELAGGTAVFVFRFAVTGSPGGEIVLREQRLWEDDPLASLSIALR